MRYEFQNTLFDSHDDLCAAIAGEWLSAGGSNTREFIEKSCAENTADEFTRECIDGYGLTDEWLSDRGIDFMSLREGFIEVMEDLATAFGWDQE